MKGWLQFLLGITVTIMLWYFLFQNNLLPLHEITLTTTDTIYVDRPYKEIVIKEVEVEVPVAVKVYKMDTLYRNQIEKDTLITSVEITPKLVHIHVLTPKGVPMIHHYNLEGYQSLKINHEGELLINESKRLKRLRCIKNVGFLISGFIIGRRTQS